MAQTFEGTVAFFLDKEGYGFITVPGREDLFVHYSGIETRSFGGRRTLVKDQKVRFEIIQGQKGPQANNVVILSE